jgi:hypothetical protein
MAERQNPIEYVDLNLQPADAGIELRFDIEFLIDSGIENGSDEPRVVSSDEGYIRVFAIAKLGSAAAVLHLTRIKKRSRAQADAGQKECAEPHLWSQVSICWEDSGVPTEMVLWDRLESFLECAFQDEC